MEHTNQREWFQLPFHKLFISISHCCPRYLIGRIVEQTRSKRTRLGKDSEELDPNVKASFFRILRGHVQCLFLLLTLRAEWRDTLKIAALCLEEGCVLLECHDCSHDALPCCVLLPCPSCPSCRLQGSQDVSSLSLLSLSLPPLTSFLLCFFSEPLDDVLFILSFHPSLHLFSIILHLVACFAMLPVCFFVLALLLDGCNDL